MHSTAAAADETPLLHPSATRLPFDHQGPFVRATSGDVLCVDAYSVRRSADDGMTWTDAPLFDASKQFRISNERALLRTREGVVIAAWMNLNERSSPKGWRWGDADVDWRDFVLPTYVCRSVDDGKTWETPIKLSQPWCGCIHSLIQMRSGRIVLVGQEIIPEWRHATVTFVSDDQGQSWQRGQLLDYGIGAHDHAGSIEGSVIERSDGSLYLLLRTESGWLWEATSTDGLTWHNLKQSQIPSVTCCPQMARLSDGRIALLWNAPPRHLPDNRTQRSELSLAFSDDDARSWSAPVVVAANYQPGGRVSYPYLYEHRPGELWITTMQGGLRMKINVAALHDAEIPVYTPPVAPAPKPHGIVMFGDSTTAERPGAVRKVYAVRVTERLQSVGSTLGVVNAGIGGNSTRDARRRFQKDVLAHKPRLIVMQFGINDSAVDVWKSPPATTSRVPLAEFTQNLTTMIREARKNGSKVILMTTNPLRWTPRLKELYGKPPYQPEADDGLDTPTLSGYNNAVRQLSEELSVPLVDVHTAWHTYAAKKKMSVDELLLDGMHPNDKGHQLVTELLIPVIRDQLR
ncbi:MAG: exo-alpha-sialidase [Fuerstiella sp.]